MDYLRSVYFILFLKKDYKWLLLKDYIRLLFISWLHSKIKLKPINRTSFLSFEIHFPCFSSFMFLIQEIFIYECYTTPEKNTKKIIDAGSHIGLSILFFYINCPDLPIDAFEINPDTYAYLVKNVKTNKIVNAKTFNHGISNRSGIQYLHELDSDLNSSISLLPTSKPVNTVDINSIINTSNIFLKLDIEGHEDLLVERLTTSEKLLFINQIVIETNKTNTFITEKLKKRGYHKIPHENMFYRNLPEEIQVFNKTQT